MYCVKEEMRDGDGKNFKMGFEDWYIIGQGTVSLKTIVVVVKQSEDDKYVTSNLVLPFIHTRVLQNIVVLSIPVLVLETRGVSFDYCIST